MICIPLRILLLGTALLVVPAAAQTAVTASPLAGIISADELSTSDRPMTPNTTIRKRSSRRKAKPQARANTTRA